jgi:hypothetical protein
MLELMKEILDTGKFNSASSRYNPIHEYAPKISMEYFNLIRTVSTGVKDRLKP